MERDRNQIAKLFYLTAFVLMPYVALVTFICYNAGKNGFMNIDWMWVVGSSIPVFIISVGMLFTGHKKYKIFSRN